MKNKKLLKVFSVILLIGVCLSLIPLSVSADDDLVNAYGLSGTRLISSNPDTNIGGYTSVGLMFVSQGGGHFSGTFQSNGTRYIGIMVHDPDIVGPTTFTGPIVYSKQFGWVSQEYRIVDFGTGVSVDLETYSWFMNNSTPIDDAAYQKGYLAGLEVGLNSSDKRDQYFQEGYDEGFQDGLDSSGSASFGQNLIGDTLSAPVRALNQFTLFTSPSGVEVSLGMIFGSMVALILFLAFLKMFAGG